MATEEPEKKAVTPPNANERMKKLLKSGFGHDMTLRCQGTEYKVHRAILHSAGGYFTGACSDAFQEGKNGVLTLDDDDCSPGPILAVLQYIYSDSYSVEDCASEDDHLVLHAKVERLAKRFLLEGLQKLSSDAFLSTLDAWSNDHDTAKSLMDTVAFVYSDPVATGDVVRAALSQALASQFNKETESSSYFHGYMEMNFALVYDLLKDQSGTELDSGYKVSCMKCQHEYVLQTRLSLRKCMQCGYCGGAK